ncbi:18488_t:CDS:2, partial [Funneliformis geosporum]
SPNIIIANDTSNASLGIFKTPTVIKYDDSYDKVESWGFPALAKKPKKPYTTSTPSLKWFKLHLLGKSLLPVGLDFKKVISDYLEKLGEDIKSSLKTHWDFLDFDKQVVVVLTVPAEFDDNAIDIMPEAAAIHSMDNLIKEHNFGPGDLLMMVDCGGGTVDLTTRDDELNEITVRTGDDCGSYKIDQAFIELLGHKVGKTAMDLFEKNYNSYLQYMVQEFCRKAKLRFTENPEDFPTFELDLEEYEPLIKYIKGEEEEKLKKDDWLIEIEYDDVKKMVDPVVNEIFKLIRGQLEQLKRLEKKISILLLVGGFGESKYLQNRIKQEFSKEEVPKFFVDKQPIVSIMKGAVKYGLTRIIKKRVLKWDYGTIAVRKWKPTDPLELKLPNGYIKVFEKLAESGKQVLMGEEVTRCLKPYSLSQQKMNIDMYTPVSDDAKYLRDVKLLRKWEVNLTELDNYEDDNTIKFTLKFDVEMSATAKNKEGIEQHVTFKY